MAFHPGSNPVNVRVIKVCLVCRSSVHHRGHEAAADEQTQQPAQRGPAHYCRGAVERMEDV